MTSLNISDSDIPDLTGKIAIITGGASGIGLASAQLLASRGCTVHALDLNAPHAEDLPSPENVIPHVVSVTDWKAMLALFSTIGHVDIAIANAGVSQEVDYFEDSFDAAGDLQEPMYNVLDVNVRGTLNFVKLALHAFANQGRSTTDKQGVQVEDANGEARTLDRGGSIVIVASATAYSPEQSLPVYSASKLALIGLVRALRSSLPDTHNATINAVAPAATVTRLLPKNLAAPIIQAGAPVSTAQHVALAVAYSATAREQHQVERYGRDSDERVAAPGPWNGRAILTLGESFTELEEPVAQLRGEWLGKWNTEMTAFQQTLTDMRPQHRQAA